MLALAEFEAGICKCGFHESLRDADGEIVEEFCPNCADLAVYDRIQRDRDEREDKRKYGEKPPADARLSGDGRIIRPRINPESRPVGGSASESG